MSLALATYMRAGQETLSALEAADKGARPGPGALAYLCNPQVRKRRSACCHRAFELQMAAWTNAPTRIGQTLAKD